MIGAPFLAIAAAALAREVLGLLDRSTYMQAGAAGSGLGVVVGAAGGIWLVSRDRGSQAGPALAWLWVASLIILLSLAWVIAQ